MKSSTIFMLLALGVATLTAVTTLPASAQKASATQKCDNVSTGRDSKQNPNARCVQATPEKYVDQQAKSAAQIAKGVVGGAPQEDPRTVAARNAAVKYGTVSISPTGQGASPFGASRSVGGDVNTTVIYVRTANGGFGRTSFGMNSCDEARFWASPAGKTSREIQASRADRK